MINITEASLEGKDEDTIDKLAEKIAHEVTNGQCDILSMVEQLGFALTAPSVEMRVNGTRLLSGVLGKIPVDLLNAMQLEFIATFYADRMKDHHNVMPAVIDGMSALVPMRHLPPECAPKLLRTFFHNSTVQSQVRSDRTKMFHLFEYLSQTYIEELKSMGGDFIFGVINSMDGERDPRNLDLLFTYMPKLIATYPLLHLSEEMFEIFACYFPIDFNPSRNDPDTITRAVLAEKLANCLVAKAEFVDWAVALALEKLDSDLVVAKVDSLNLLRQAALKFSPDSLAPHFPTIWPAIKEHVLPGSDNEEVRATALSALRSILEESSKIPEISRNNQTIVMGSVLPHLNDINQRLFNPAAAVALVCVAGDPQFASEKILHSFLIKLNAADEVALNDEERIKIYNTIGKIFEIMAHKCNFEELKNDVINKIHADAIEKLRLDRATVGGKQENRDLLCAALNVLSACAPALNETNRALIYKTLAELIMHERIDLEFTFFLEQLGALQPIELQSNCIDLCISRFASSSNFVKGKIYSNLLPLVKQIAFTHRILDLIFSNIFSAELSIDAEERLIALRALNTLLVSEDSRFIQELQHNNCLIDKLVQLAKSAPSDLMLLEQIALVLSVVIRQLGMTEQYMIADEYLPQLNLQVASHLYIAKGLLGFLHKDLSLDDHFERLLGDLTNLSLHSDNVELRQVAHHLLCSLVNKTDRNQSNRSIIAKVVAQLKAEIKKGDAKAVEVLSWLAKGLVMNGYEEAGEIIETLAKLLDHPTLAKAACLAFEIISAEYPELHLPIVHFLYKQRFFHVVMQKFGHKLESYCEHHLNAFISVLKHTPHNVLKMSIEKIGPILFKSLDSNEVHTVCIGLEVCRRFIKVQDEYFRSHLNHVIPSYVKLANTFKMSMEVRISALNLLLDITKYPTFVVLPYRMDVVLDLAQALDDPKRLVRNAAVAARNAWFLVGTSI